MGHIPQMAAISELKNDHLVVLARSTKEPVLLASRNQPVGVLVSPVHWERLLQTIEDLEDTVDVLNTLLAEARGELQVETLENHTFGEWLDAEPIST